MLIEVLLGRKSSPGHVRFGVERAGHVRLAFGPGGFPAFEERHKVSASIHPALADLGGSDFTAESAIAENVPFNAQKAGGLALSNAKAIVRHEPLGELSNNCLDNGLEIIRVEVEFHHRTPLG